MQLFERSPFRLNQIRKPSRMPDRAGARGTVSIFVFMQSPTAGGHSRCGTDKHGHTTRICSKSAAADISTCWRWRFFVVCYAAGIWRRVVGPSKPPKARDALAPVNLTVAKPISLSLRLSALPAAFWSH